MSETVEPIEPPKATEPEVKPADMNSRVFAAILDMCIIMVIIWPVLMFVSNRIFGPFDPSSITAAAQMLPDVPAFWAKMQQSGILHRYIIDSFMQVGAVGIFIVPFWVNYGATPGKYLLRMRVVQGDTLNFLTYPQAILRYLCYATCVFTLGLGVIWIGFNKKKRALHDILAHTRVIILPRGKTL